MTPMLAAAALSVFALVLTVIVAVVLGLGAMATTMPDKESSFNNTAIQQIVAIPFIFYPQVTTDITTTGPSVKMPFKGRVIKAQGIVRAAAGDVVHTDVDCVFKNATDSTTIATCPAVNASTIAAGGAIASPVSGAVAEFDANDVVRMEIDITGGTNPTCDGVQGILWVERY